MIKEVIVEVIQYETEDGKKHVHYEDAVQHERMLKGLSKQCPSCEGRGVVPNEDFRGIYACNQCSGKGIVHKKEVWTN